MKLKIVLIDAVDSLDALYGFWIKTFCDYQWLAIHEVNAQRPFDADLVLVDPEVFPCWKTLLEQRPDLRVLLFLQIDRWKQIDDLVDPAVLDFVAKSVSPFEFRARLLKAAKAYPPIFTKTSIESSEPFGDRLTSVELKVLREIWALPNGLATREYLNRKIWGLTQVNSKTLDVHIYNLRKKLEGTPYQIVFQGSAWSVVVSGSDSSE